MDRLRKIIKQIMIIEILCGGRRWLKKFYFKAKNIFVLILI